MAQNTDSQIIKKPFYKRWYFWVIIIFVLYIIGSSNSPNNIENLQKTANKNETTNNTSTQKTVVTTTKTNEVQVKNVQDKATAQKELDDFIKLSKEAGLVTTYEFSDKATVVYVDKAWYSQTVQFKKDFMAKIAMLKHTITGYNHFEVHDAYSDEKVAEVTAFSGSLEVYK